jgi:hypothetical protein
LEDERPLLIDDDFSWSDLPARRSRRPPAPPPARANLSRCSERKSDSADSRYMPADRDIETRYVQTRYAEMSDVQMSDVQLSDVHMRDVHMRDASSSDAQAEVRRTEAEFEQARGRWAASHEHADSFDRDDAASYATARVLEDRSGALEPRHSGRRTVIITGRGDSRYTIAPARRRSSELRFHERAVFNPDRTAKWAVLLGIALLIGCIAH